MDGGISDMISGVLSNPDSLNKILTLMPVVTQMMNGGGSNNSQNKIVETTAVNKPPETPAPNISAENLMANAEVAAALKNLITALNAASAGNNNANQNSSGETSEIKPEAVMTSANTYNTDNTNNINIDKGKIENIVNMLGANFNKPPENNPAYAVDAVDAVNEDNNGNKIEKTLDTLKNFSKATSPETDHRLKLLLALKPFLKDGRKTKIDSAIKYMNAAKIINMFGKNGFV